MKKDTKYYETLYRIWSVIVLGTGSKLLCDLSAEYESGYELYCALNDDVEGWLPSEVVKAAKNTPLSAAEQIMDKCEKLGIKIVTVSDRSYPKRLRKIDSTPSVLYYKGDISGIDDRRAIGIVGSRRPSEYSRMVASGIAAALSKHGYDIISGFAEGIDICAHMTAVKNGARTYAVLGAGIDVMYPRSNEVFKRYIAQSGAVISEYPPETKPLPIHFLQRNRILAGLSQGIAVIEAGAKSGSLNSASHCREQGKTVFAVPPADLFDERYKGNIDLIRNGAVVLMGAGDIYNEYGSSSEHTIATENKYEPETIKDNADREHTAADNSPKNDTVSIAEQRQSPIERAALRALENNDSGLRCDEIAEICGEDIGELLTALTELEIEGLVESENSIYKIK